MIHFRNKFHIKQQLFTALIYKQLQGIIINRDDLEAAEEYSISKLAPASSDFIELVNLNMIEDAIEVSSNADEGLALYRHLKSLLQQCIIDNVMCSCSYITLLHVHGNVHNCYYSYSVLEARIINSNYNCSMVLCSFVSWIKHPLHFCCCRKSRCEKSGTFFITIF